MTPEEEHEFYARPENRRLTGTPTRRRRTPLNPPVPVRFPPDLQEAIREDAERTHRTLSAWLREAAREKLERESAGHREAALH